MSTKEFKENKYMYKEVAHLHSLTLTEQDINNLQDAYDKHSVGIIEHILIEVYNRTHNQKHLPRR